MEDVHRWAEAFGRQLDSRLEAARLRLEHDLAALRQGGQVDLPAANQALPLQRRADGAWLAGQPAALPIVPARLDLTTHPQLERVDDVFIAQFNGLWRGARLLPRYPTFFCETLDEFLQPQLQAADLSPAQKDRLLAEWQTRSETLARQSGGRAGVFGVNLPGQGCYLNGWLFNYGRPGRPRDCLEDARLRPRILETAAHEKWGHGFITDFTALGAEKKALGLQFLDLASRFGHRPVDTPTWSLLIERYNAVHRVSEFLEEGWATWIEGALMNPLLVQPIRPRPTLREVWNAVANAEAAAEPRETALTALRGLFLDERPDWETVHLAVLTLQGLSAAGRLARDLMDTCLSREFGQPAPYIIGALLVDRIGVAWGPRAAPAAVMIAANLAYDLNRLGSTDLERLVGQPRFNPDSRLAALSRLPVGGPGDVRGMILAAREHLNLAVPAELEP